MPWFFGVISPCQLTTNLGALAFSASRPGRFGLFSCTSSVKVIVYSVVDGIVILLGVQLQAISIPIVVLARKLLGPLMILVGLGMLGVIRLPTGIGSGLNRRVRERLLDGSHWKRLPAGRRVFVRLLSDFFLALLRPHASAGPADWRGREPPGVLRPRDGAPAPCTRATTVFQGLSTGERLAGGLSRWHRWIAWVAGVLFAIAGLHDTLVYRWRRPALLRSSPDAVRYGERSHRF